MSLPELVSAEPVKVRLTVWDSVEDEDQSSSPLTVLISPLARGREVPGAVTLVANVATCDVEYSSSHG